MFTSPFGTSFKTAIKNGTPCFTAITSISKRTGKSPTTIISSLKKAGLVWTVTVSGTPVCWPTFPCKTSIKNAKTCQPQCWNWFISYCLSSGVCTPRQLANLCTSPSTFVTGCSKFFGKQVGVKPAVKISKSRTRRSTRSHSGWGKVTTYKFPSYGRSYRSRKAA